jgi:hypothetical protein
MDVIKVKVGQLHDSRAWMMTELRRRLQDVPTGVIGSGSSDDRALRPRIPSYHRRNKMTRI